MGALGSGAASIPAPAGSRNPIYAPKPMVPALGCDDFLLDQSHKLRALRQGQAQSRNVAQIIGAVDYHHVDASTQSLDPGFHQTHPILDPQPAKNSADHTLPATAARQSPL